MTQHSDIRIRPAIAKDIAACAICWGNRRNTYPSIYPLRLADPSITREERLERNARDLSNSLRDPHNVMHVACISQLGDPTTSKVVGYSIWARPEGLERDLRHWEDQKMKAFQYDKASNDDLDPECNHELAAELKEESMRVKKKLSQGKRMW